MPDLTPAAMAACTSAVGEHKITGSRGDTYTVVCSGRWEWTCDCPAHKYRPHSWCKHIEQVVVDTCTWNQLLDGGSPNDGLCPACGGPVEYFTAMV